MGKVLVIVNCSRRKSVNMEEVRRRLGRVPGFDLENEGWYREVLSDLVKPALDMYDGPEFRVLRRFRDCIDVFVLSARYGVVSGDRLIIPYDAYLGNADEYIIQRWAVYGSPDLGRLISGRWDYVIIRLTRTYMSYFRKLVINPCALGEEIHVITARSNTLNCGNAVHHFVRGPGDSQSVLRRLLIGLCPSISNYSK